MLVLPPLLNFPTLPMAPIAYCLCTSYEIPYIPVFFTDCYFISNSNLDTTLCWESSITVVIVEHYKLDVLQVAVVIDSPASCSDERH